MWCTHPSTGQVWQTPNIGKSPRVSNNLIISGAVHGQMRGHCLGVVCPTLAVIGYRQTARTSSVAARGDARRQKHTRGTIGRRPAPRRWPPEVTEEARDWRSPPSSAGGAMCSMRRKRTRSCSFSCASVSASRRPVAVAVSDSADEVSSHAGAGCAEGAGVRPQTVLSQTCRGLSLYNKGI